MRLPPPPDSRHTMAVDRTDAPEPLVIPLETPRGGGAAGVALRLLRALLVIGGGAAAVAAALWILLSPPWLGLRFGVDRGDVRVAAAEGPAQGLAPGAVVLLEGGGRRLQPLPEDLAATPLALPTYAAQGEQLARQQILAEVLRGGRVRLLTQTAAGLRRESLLTPAARPWTTAPARVWIILAAGAAALLAAAAPWIAAPRRQGAGLLLGAGVAAAALSAASAALVGRELAYEAWLLRSLGWTSVGAALALGGLLFALLLRWPRRLAPRRAVTALLLALAAWGVAAGLELPANPTLGAPLALTAVLALIVTAAIWQAAASRRDPVARAQLTWAGLGATVGAGGFVLISAAPVALGLPPAPDVGAVHWVATAVLAGLAAGVAGWRLPQARGVSALTLFAVIGALLFIGLDAALVTSGLSPAAALGAALAAIGVLYLPLRAAVRRWLAAGRDADRPELLRLVMDTALAPTRAEATAAWRDVLQQVFRPRETLPVAPGEPADSPRLADLGRRLVVPSVGLAPAFQLSDAAEGRRLFDGQDRRLARTLGALAERAELSRQRYAASLAEERRRLSRDLQTDVGERMQAVSGGPNLEERARLTLTSAHNDLKGVIHALRGEHETLEQVLAGVRGESLRRLEAVRIQLDWAVGDTPDLPLDYAFRKALTDAIREVVRNVVRHSGARKLSVRLRVEDGVLGLRLADDGRGAGEEALGAGGGLGRSRERLAELRGGLELRGGDFGTIVWLWAPLRD